MNLNKVNNAVTYLCGITVIITFGFLVYLIVNLHSISGTVNTSFEIYENLLTELQINEKLKEMNK